MNKQPSKEQRELSILDMKMVMSFLQNKKEVQFNFNDDETMMYIRIDLTKWSDKKDEKKYHCSSKTEDHYIFEGERFCPSMGSIPCEENKNE